MVRTEYHRLDAPSLGGSGEVAVHGHWGRPVLWFPAEAGQAWEFEAQGMLDARSSHRCRPDQGLLRTGVRLVVVVEPRSVAG